MNVRSVALVLHLILGAAVSSASMAVSRVIPMVDHPGASQEQLERVYTEAYEQSGFHLIDRHKQEGYGNSWAITLTFELTGTSHADNVPGTTLMITSGMQSAPCSPCQLARLNYMAPDASNLDPTVRARGRKTLATADAAALAKVRQRLGVSLPEAPLSETAAP